MNNQNELQHYGVPGMKWGVRRNIRVLATRRRNVQIKNAKKAYKSGQLNRSEKRAAIKDAKTGRKTEITKMRSDVNSASNRTQFKNIKRDIAKQTINEVPARTIKKGLTTVNKFIATYNVGGTVVAAVGGAALNPALAGAFITGGAIGTAANAGMHYIAQLGIDKIT